MTSECEFPYGERSLKARLPEEYKLTIFKSHYTGGLVNPAEAIVNCLRSPIGSPPLCDCLKPDNTFLCLVSGSVGLAELLDENKCNFNL